MAYDAVNFTNKRNGHKKNRLGRIIYESHKLLSYVGLEPTTLGAAESNSLNHYAILLL